MIKFLSKEQMRELVDKGLRILMDMRPLQLGVQQDRKGDYLVRMAPNNEFPYEIIVNFTAYDSGLIVMGACSPEMSEREVSRLEHIFDWCNDWNEQTRIPTAYIDPNAYIKPDHNNCNVYLKYGVVVDEDVSEEFIIHSCICYPCYQAYGFFSNLERRLKRVDTI
jgi:hypothetical protein